MKYCICCKMLSNRTRIQRPRMPHLNACGDQSKINKVIKALRVTCAPLTGTAKGFLLAFNFRCLNQAPSLILVISGYKIFYIKVKQNRKNQERCFLAAVNDYSSNYAELLLSSFNLFQQKFNNHMLQLTSFLIL